MEEEDIGRFLQDLEVDIMNLQTLSSTRVVSTNLVRMMKLRTQRRVT